MLEFSYENLGHGLIFKHKKEWKPCWFTLSIVERKNNCLFFWKKYSSPYLCKNWKWKHTTYSADSKVVLKPYVISAKKIFILKKIKYVNYTVGYFNMAEWEIRM